LWACEEDCAGFAIFSPRYKRGGFFRVSLLLWTAIQVSSRDNSRGSIYVLYSNLNRKLWARVFCTHICVCVYAFIHICLFVICLRIHTYTTHTHTHTQTYTAYTRNALCNFFSLSSVGLLLVGLCTSTWNIYVCVNWTLGIDDMRRKIKIRKNCELWMRFMNGTDDRYTTGECKKSAFTLLN